MASDSAPTRHARRDVLKSIFGSRIALGVVFFIFFLVGLICVRLEDSTSVSIGTSLIASALVSLATLMIDQIRNSEQMRAADLASSASDAWACASRGLSSATDC